MAIKTLRFSFDLPIADILALVATRNDALQIDVVGDGKPDKTPKHLRNGKEAIAGLLEGPRAHSRKVKARDQHGSLTTYQAVAIFLMRAPDHTGKVPDMKHALEPLGVNGVSISPQLVNMRKEGNVKQLEPGLYRLTQAGVRNFEKMIKQREQGAQQ